MKELSSEEIKNRSLGMLKQLDVFCREHHINYSLGEGTLLGAIRHKGFIPWDDDIDVIMCREDYERFICEYNKKKTDGDSRVISIHNDNNWHKLFSRLVDTTTVVQFEAFEQQVLDHHGLWIDILPIDNAPTNLEPLIKMVKKIRRLYNLEVLRIYPAHKNPIIRFIKKVICVLLRLLPPNYFSKRAELVLKQYSSIHTKKKGFFSCIWHDPYIFSASVFDEYVEADFEGNIFSIAKGYDEYLRAQYGDYMVLPPVEKRVADHHPYKAYYLS